MKNFLKNNTILGAEAQAFTPTGIDYDDLLRSDPESAALAEIIAQAEDIPVTDLVIRRTSDGQLKISTPFKPVDNDWTGEAA